MHHIVAMFELLLSPAMKLMQSKKLGGKGGLCLVNCHFMRGQRRFEVVTVLLPLQRALHSLHDSFHKLTPLV
jgi:hypothetical protein